MNLFQSLITGLGADERLRFEIRREGAALTVLVQPILKTAPTTLTDEQQCLRAALAHPLYLTGTPEQLDADLLTALTRYGEQRGTLPGCAESPVL